MDDLFSLSETSATDTGNRNSNEKRKVDIVYKYLKEKIITGDFAPGERIILRNISNILNVSDIPVREALQLLNANGLVNIIPYSGAIVTSPSLQDLKEAMIIRLPLEKLAIETSAPKLTKKDVKELTVCLNKMNDCLNKNDYSNYSILNRKFHAILYRHTYKLLLNLIDTVNYQSERAMMIFKEPHYIEQSYNEHVKMLESIKNNNINDLKEIIISHRERVKNDLSRVIKEIKRYKNITI